MKKQALAAAVAAAIAGPAYADPPPRTDLPRVFCFRITDIERPLDAYENNDPVNGALLDDNVFLFEFEVLNWTHSPANGMMLSLNEGSSAGVVIGGASIDVDGRGGSVGDENDPKFGEIGAANPVGTISHQSGRGRSDIDNALNDWDVLRQTNTQVIFDAQVEFEEVVQPPDDYGYGGFSFFDIIQNGTSIPNEDLLFGGGTVPGDGTGNDNDSSGDTAIDGGPGTGAAFDAGEGNVLDGFVLRIDGLDVGKTLSLNWELLRATNFGDNEFAAAVDGGEGPPPSCVDDPTACFDSIGTGFFGNNFGFGVFSIANLGVGGALPGPLFVGNAGFNQNPITFFDTVWDLPNPTDFGGEFGGGQVAEFQDPDDNIFGARINTQLAIPEPTTLALAGLALAGLGASRRRKQAV